MRCRADAFRAQVLDGALFVMGGWATLNLAEHVMLLSFCDVAPARCCLSHENLRQQFGSEWSWVGGCCAPPPITTTTEGLGFGDSAAKTPATTCVSV